MYNQNEAEDLIDILYEYFGVAGNIELAEKMNITRQTITNWKKRNSINPIKKKCRELGIYNEIFKNTQTHAELKKTKIPKSIEKQHGNTIKINNLLLQRISEIAEQYEMSETEYINFLLLQDIKKETHQTQGA